MKWFLIIRSLILLCAIFFVSCGNGFDEIEPPGNNLGPATITTSMEGSQAASAVLQARDFVITSTSLFKNLGEFGIAVMTNDPTLANMNTDISCADGGTFTYDGTTSGGTYDLTFTFAGCRADGFQYEGSYALTGTATSISVTLGGGSTFNIFYFNDAYTVLIAYLKAQSSFTMTGSGSATSASYTITASGRITDYDYFLLNTYTIYYSGFTTDYLLSTDAGTGDQTISLTTNGFFSESWTSAILSATLSNFNVNITKDYDSGSGTFIADDSSVIGTVTFDYRPNNYCLEGQVDVLTSVAVHNDYGLGYTTQGTMTLTGTDTATVQYNAGGDVDVTVASDPPVNYSREYVLMKMCDYSGLEQTIPPLLGTTGSATGSTMTVTLTWYGGSTSDMDLHVKYYNITSPIPTTTEAWHVDWHQGKTCADPAGLSFSDAFDLNEGGSGTCDAGLDFDDVDGYGPEHITMTTIPTGYYIVSVNSFSLDSDPDATVYLAIHIGDYIFGPYSTTLVTADGEGTTLGAWFRVADVRVNGDGTVDVLTPDLTLAPWH